MNAKTAFLGALDTFGWWVALLAVLLVLPFVVLLTGPQEVAVSCYSVEPSRQTLMNEEAQR